MALPQSVADAAHKEVAQQAIDWQQYSTVAKTWEMGATVNGAEEGRAYALAGQMASIGEQLGLARAAANEVALWRTVRGARRSPDPIDEMSIRAVAEAQCLFVYGAGHGLANACLRALALDRQLPSALSQQLTRGKSTFPPFSNNRDDWISLNVSTARGLMKIAKGSGHAKVEELAKAVSDLGQSKAWEDLLARRGEDFHRWRPQTHGIVGVTKSNPWERERPGTRKRSFGGSPTYDDARDLADETADIATRAMMRLAEAMKAFEEAWPKASPLLGGPRFKTS